MTVIGTNIVHDYFNRHRSDQGIKAARSSYNAWEEITLAAAWRIPPDVQSSHRKASILKGSRVVFNIKGNDYRLICEIIYQIETVVVRWFGSHDQYDEIDAENI